METVDKETLIKRTEELKLKHESLKGEMIKNLEASQLLETQYVELERQLYMVEDEYMSVMKKLME